MGIDETLPKVAYNREVTSFIVERQAVAAYVQSMRARTASAA